MKIHTRAARAAIFAAAALSIAGCDMLGGGSADKGIPAGAGAGAEAAAPAAPAAPVAPVSNLDPLLASPAVGDVWAANLDHFSAAEFGEPGGADAFGLVRVVNVTDSQVTIITETSSSPDAAAATARLSDYQGSVTWDEQERIPVNRSDFEALVRDQRIVRPTRPAAGGGGGGSGDYNAGGGAAPAAPGAPAAPPPPAAPGGSK